MSSTSVEAEATTVTCRARIDDAISSLSRHGVMAAAILSGFTTFIPGILINFGLPIQLGVKIFIVLYLATLPMMVSVLYELYSFAKKIISICNAPRVDPVSFIIGVLPFGFIAVLYYIEALLASYCERLRGKIRLSIIDFFINLIVLGLHVIIFARIFNYIIDNILPQVCGED